MSAAEPRMQPQAAARALPAWPADAVPTPAEAEGAVRAVLAGSAALDPALSARVLADLTDLERAAFAAADDEVTAPIRAAGALRWRLGAAILNAPERGPVDVEFAAALLAETDAVLAAVQGVADGGPGPLADAVAAIRKAVVSDAISLSNVLQRLGAQAPAAPVAAAPKAPVARVLSVVDPAEAYDEPARRGSPLVWIALVVAALVAGGYHGYRFLNPRRPAPLLAGGTQNAVAAPERNGRSLVVTRDGKPFSERELAELRAAQKARGRRVVELAPGVYAVEPGSDSGREVSR